MRQPELASDPAVWSPLGRASGAELRRVAPGGGTVGGARGVEPVRGTDPRSTAAFAGTRNAATASSSPTAFTPAMTSSRAMPLLGARDVSQLFADPRASTSSSSCVAATAPRRSFPTSTSTSIAENPKPLVGYSDVTALHVAIRQRTGLVTFYGPGFTGMGSPKRGGLVEGALPSRRHRPEPLGEVPGRPDDPYIGSIGHRRARRPPLVGGCLWLLRETLATPWELDIDESILFFEDVHCPPWHVDGMLRRSSVTPEARPRRGRRDRRDVQVRRVPAAGALAAEPLDGGRLRAPPRTAGSARSCTTSRSATETTSAPSRSASRRQWMLMREHS